MTEPRNEDLRPPTGSSFGVVVFSCGDLGVEVANRLSRLADVDAVTLVSAPYRHPRRSLARKIKHAYRMLGPVGLLRAIVGRVFGRRRTAPDDAVDSPKELAEEVSHLRFDQFSSRECLAAVDDLGVQLGVVAGTYILPKELFALPALGSINLHSGDATRYRGSAPGFWEMYNGEETVGITIHRVTDVLDGGAILAQQLFPLNPAPPGDPQGYLIRYRRQVLRPNGVRLLAETVARIRAGTVEERQQPAAEARTYRMPTFRETRELRRRVQQRRSV